MRIFCETDTTHLYGVDHCVWPGLGVGYLCVYIYSICTNIPYVDDAMPLWDTLFTLDIRNLYKRDISRIDLMRYRHLSSNRNRNRNRNVVAHSEKLYKQYIVVYMLILRLFVVMGNRLIASNCR